MGKEKALLPFSNSKSFVNYLIDIYSQMNDSTLIVVLNRENEDKIKFEIGKRKKPILFLINPEPEKGRFSSIKIGLDHIQKGRGAFIQNIDNPFITKELIAEMQKRYQVNAFLVPQYNGKNGHPLLLGADLVRELKESKDSIHDLKSFLDSKEKQIVKTKGQGVLANINSPEDYQYWFS